MEFLLCSKLLQLIGQYVAVIERIMCSINVQVVCGY